MSTLATMKKLTRLPLGQLQASSDPQIVRDLKHATLDLAAEIEVLGEPLDYAHLLNAWVWGLARLPAPERMAVTKLFVKDLERWQLEQQTTPGEQLAGQLREILVLAGPREDRVEAEKRGTVLRPGRDDKAGVQAAPGPARSKRRS